MSYNSIEDQAQTLLYTDIHAKQIFFSPLNEIFQENRRLHPCLPQNHERAPAHTNTYTTGVAHTSPVALFQKKCLRSCARRRRAVSPGGRSVDAGDCRTGQKYFSRRRCWSRSPPTAARTPGRRLSACTSSTQYPRSGWREGGGGLGGCLLLVPFTVPELFLTPFFDRFHILLHTSSSWRKAWLVPTFPHLFFQLFIYLFLFILLWKLSTADRGWAGRGVGGGVYEANGKGRSRRIVCRCANDAKNNGGTKSRVRRGV